MKYRYINDMDIYNGPGVRITLFLQGCESNINNSKDIIHLKDFNNGREFESFTEDEVIHLCGSKATSGLTISGAEPFDWVPHMFEYYTYYSRKFAEIYEDINSITIEEVNNYYDTLSDELLFEINPLYHLIKRFKDTYIEKTVWLYTKYDLKDLFLDTSSYPEIAIGSEVCMPYIDVITNGPYIYDGKDFEESLHKYDNYKCIDVKRSILHNEIITYGVPYNREAL